MFIEILLIFSMSIILQRYFIISEIINSFIYKNKISNYSILSFHLYMRIKNNTYSYINSFSKSIALFQSNRNTNTMYDTHFNKKTFVNFARCRESELVSLLFRHRSHYYFIALQWFSWNELISKEVETF